MNSDRLTIGQSEFVDFPELNLQGVPARIDTGARTSTIWATDIKEQGDKLSFTLFDEQSEHFDGKVVKIKQFETRVVTPSNGISEERYMVRLQVRVGGRKMRARFTLANRATQKYPVLIGRNILRGKFIVDIKHNHVPVKAHPISSNK